ncbi:hypothetical protein ACJMK2_026335, partial [Sinanodonta woodiana]
SENAFCYVKVNFEEFDAMYSLLVKTPDSLLPVMEYFRQIGSTVIFSEEYSRLIKVLASPSPVSEKILGQEKITLPQMEVRQEYYDVPSFLKTALREVICKVKITFEGHKGQDTGLPIGPASRDAIYPALPEKWEVPFYCRKHGRHSTLLPGIFTVFCQHGM